ncbi:Mu transposase C-terminal domain-containing protein [Paenibacillus albidus]|uniref:Mu transposase C-terminal domain-containing protein n=1 Tax=Paenibacillus albidus TaxID=2041023 RepID=UPI001BE59B74|nr:Mu transposase C-terminal domain-containing protein [Paenibacillus albidus]MBT2291455.1 Mu transposase C-terminal domain-containing protein [Paenibacillus albidus]
MRNLALGKVTESGIDFQGLNYSCPEAIHNEWFKRVREESEWKIPVVFNTSDFTQIHVFVSGVKKWVPANIFFPNKCSQI